MRIYRKAGHRTADATAKAADTLRQPLSFISREMIADVFNSQARGRLDISVCFTGHRHISLSDEEALLSRLDALLEALYRRGFRDFICGGAIGFDTLAAEAVIRLREKNPDARLILALPCASQSEHWSPADCNRYERILYLADQTHVLSPHYYSGCMQVRNRFMVDRSMLCVCYLIHMRGGTMSTVSYALQQERTIVNLAMPDACEAFLHGT
ncbi:MAG: DUF1273 family protein [Clostridia bacterium]|nr:DUF1273 family protein [Clostridia bacterium]